jgi:hypothetical protein
MRVRQIEPDEPDAQRIDGIMQSWQEEAAGVWEADLREKLGGPPVQSQSVTIHQTTLLPISPAPEVFAPVPPVRPAGLAPGTRGPVAHANSHDPGEAASRLWDPPLRQPRSSNGEEPRHPHLSLDAPRLTDAPIAIVERPHTVISHSNGARSHRRSTKRWKKGSKARRR